MRDKQKLLRSFGLGLLVVFLLPAILYPLFYQTLEDHGLLAKPEGWLWVVLIDIFQFLGTRWFCALAGMSLGFFVGSWLDEIVRRNKVVAAPEIGTLQFQFANMYVEIKESTNEVAGKIEVELENSSERTLRYRVITAGNINGVPFSDQKVEFEGFIYPKKPIRLVSSRILNIPLKMPQNLKDPSLVGIYEYDISYGYAGEKLTRRSARGCRIECWHLKRKEPGSKTEIPLTVITYDPFEG